MFGDVEYISREQFLISLYTFIVTPAIYLFFCVCKMSDTINGPIFSNWYNLPPEIYTLIFNKLDAKDLITCLLVNRSWRRILQNDSRIDWQKVAKQGLLGGCEDLKRKLDLDWQSVVFRSGLWTFGFGHIKLELVHTYNGQNSFLPAMAVHKDKLYVSTGNHAECVLIETYEHIHLEMSEDYCVVEETDQIRLLFNGESKLRLIGKKPLDDSGSDVLDSSMIFESWSRLLYLLDQDRCYIFFENKYLKLFLWVNEAWESRNVSKFYGSSQLTTMVGHGQRLYFMGRHGDMWETSQEERCFKRLTFLNLPPFFHLANSNAMLKIMAVTSERDCLVRELGAIFKKEATCSTYHAGVLLFSFSTGQIEAWILNNTDVEIGIEQSNRPSTSWWRCYYLLTLYEHIFNMTVYDGENCMYLLINCLHTIYQYKITHPGLV